MSWQALIANQNAPTSRRRRDDPEAREQAALVQVLRLNGVRFNAQHNGLPLTPAQAAKAKAAGTERGCPDLLIFDAPPGLCECSGYRSSPIRDAPGPCGWWEWTIASTVRLGGCPVCGCGVLAHPSSSVGCAIEMKRPDIKPKTDRAGRFSGAEPHQREWLEALESRGWAVFVAYGCDDALMKLRELGYGV